MMRDATYEPPVPDPRQEDGKTLREDHLTRAITYRQIIDQLIALGCEALPEQDKIFVACDALTDAESRALYMHRERLGPPLN